MKSKQIMLSALLISILLLQIVAISASVSSDARNTWREAKKVSQEMRERYREKNLKYLNDGTDKSNQEAIQAGKNSLNAALDEIEAWLLWKEKETEENTEVPGYLKDDIFEDIDKNKAVIDDLKNEVEDIDNRLELGVVWIKMVGKYLELITDVARDSGKIWVFIANKRVENLEEYEIKLRDIAEHMSDNTDVLRRLDSAQREIKAAKYDINDAEEDYSATVIGERPLMSFHEGNQHLRLARINMINAHSELNQAMIKIIQRQ